MSIQRIGDAVCYLLLGLAAVYVGWCVWSAGQAVQQALFDVTIPVRLNFESLGAAAGDNAAGVLELRGTTLRDVPAVNGSERSAEPPRDRGQAQESKGTLDLALKTRGRDLAATSEAPAPVYGGYIYDPNLPALMLPEPLAALIFCESGNNPNAVGSRGERGLTQISPSVHAWRLSALGVTPDELFDPVRNAYVATEIWIEEGVKPWSCSR